MENFFSFTNYRTLSSDLTSNSSKCPSGIKTVLPRKRQLLPDSPAIVQIPLSNGFNHI